MSRCPGRAFSDIGQKLKGYDPKSTVFYASGRASLETSYMYQLFARLYGHNNLPDSSNMCHETTSVALPQSIGTPVGTVLLDDFAATDCILSFGQNVGTNSPRLLHTLQQVRERDVPIIVFNPLRERGWEAFVNPQRPGQMLTNAPTQIATQYHQPRAGGDIAAMLGIGKVLLALDDEAKAAGRTRILDEAFIAEHTQDFPAFEAKLRETGWDEIIEASGLPRAAMEAAAATYAKATATIAIYGMGLTQHRLGVDSVQMLVNLLLMRGQIGKPGAGICPVRGHSNVQGQRTVGIAEKAELVPLDRLAEQYRFEPPREDGLATVEACEAIMAGEIRAFIGLGGNFVRAIPERELMEAKWGGIDLSVQIATKLNRCHLITGRTSYLLPTLVPLRDRRAGERAADRHGRGLDHLHPWLARQVETGCRDAASEPRIVAELAKATLEPNPQVPWDEWVADYAKVRDAIEATYPDQFERFNQRLDIPAVFRARCGAPEALGDRERQGPFQGAQGPLRQLRRWPRPWRAAVDHAALERPVQHHRLRL